MQILPVLQLILSAIDSRNLLFTPHNGHVSVDGIDFTPHNGHVSVDAIDFTPNGVVFLRRMMSTSTDVT